MNKDLKYGILFLFLGIFVVLSTFLSSAILISPASSATIGGTSVLLNATNSSLPVMLNCSFYAGSSSTANTTWTFLGAATNLTANAPHINMSFNSKLLEDSNDYSFNATCRNSSNSATSSVNTGITIDNTVPNAPTLTSPASASSITSSTTQTFTCGVTNANTTGCTIYFGRNSAYSASSADSSSASMTYSASTCTYDRAFTTVTDNGNWYWYCTASDGTNSTQSASINQLNVGIAGNVGGGANVRANTQGNTLAIGSNTTPGNQTWGIVALVIIGIFALVIFFKKR